MEESSGVAVIISSSPNTRILTPLTAIHTSSLPIQSIRNVTMPI